MHPGGASLNPPRRVQKVAVVTDGPYRRGPSALHGRADAAETGEWDCDVADDRSDRPPTPARGSFVLSRILPHQGAAHMTSHQLVPDDPRFDAPLETVLDAAFGPGRFSKVSERVREFSTLDRALSRVALSGETIKGCCRIYRIRIGETPALFLGPLAVAPSAQGAGLGQELVGASLAACDASGFGGVIVVGQPWMFEPFGFTRIPDGRVIMPGPTEARRFQWRALKEGGLDALAGAVRAPRAAS